MLMHYGVEQPPNIGEFLELEWPCEAPDGSGEQRMFWLLAEVLELTVPPDSDKSAGCRKQKYKLRFPDDGGVAWNSLRSLRWRRPSRSETPSTVDVVVNALPSPASPVHELKEIGLPPADEFAEREDTSGFVHVFDLDDDLLQFCDQMHEERDQYGDKTRGDSAYGEPLHGGLVSVVIRRDALPARERELYTKLHHKCADEVPRVWPEWLRQAAGRHAKARPSQDLRLLQYSAGANFKAHVDSGWACQALVYLNEDFRGGKTSFPNLGACYTPKRGRVLLWRSVSVGHRPAVPGTYDDHPALHVAGEVFDGVKRVVSVNLVLA